MRPADKQGPVTQNLSPVNELGLVGTDGDHGLYCTFRIALSLHGALAAREVLTASPRDWLSADHQVHFLLDLVHPLDPATIPIRSLG